MRSVVTGTVASIVLIAAFLVGWRFSEDMKSAGLRAAQGSMLIATRCGPIEYQEAGTGTPLHQPARPDGSWKQRSMTPFDRAPGTADEPRSCRLTIRASR